MRDALAYALAAAGCALLIMAEARRRAALTLLSQRDSRASAHDTDHAVTRHLSGAELPLAGRVALVTGSGRGLGRGVALALARLGADVVVNDLPGGAGEQAAGETAAAVAALGRRSTVALADVSDPALVDAMVQRAVAAHGRLDICVANAAWSHRAPLIEQDVALARKTIEVSQMGALYTARAAAAQMCAQAAIGGRESRGKIVLVSSIMGQHVLGDAVAYSMAKAAVIHLGGCLASELAEKRVNVNVICPGWMDTEGERQFDTEATIQQLAPHLPWNRLGTPAEVGGLAAFLCSAAADYISGSTFVIDGGYSVDLRPKGIVAHLAVESSLRA
jgi:glucose 1-dehydrogenase